MWMTDQSGLDFLQEFNAFDVCNPGKGQQLEFSTQEKPALKMNLIEYQFCSVGRQYRKARGKHTISKMYKLTFFFIYYWSFSNNTPPCKSNELSWDLFPESNNVSESNNIGICHQQSLLTVPSCILWCGIILGCQ